MFFRFIKGTQGEEGVSHCLMSTVSILAGEAFTHNPKTTCPALAGVAIHLNDGIEHDTWRNELLNPLIFHLLGTRGPAGDEEEIACKRAELIVEYVNKLTDRANPVIPVTMDTIVTSACSATEDLISYAGRKLADQYSHGQSDGKFIFCETVANFVDFLIDEVVPVYEQEMLNLAAWGCAVSELIYDESAAN